MSATTTQHPPSFQQMGLLRKAIVQKSTGALTYISESGHHGRLAITMGDIIGGEEALKELSHLFTEAVQQCDWVERPAENNSDWMEAPLAVSRVINQVQWDNVTIMKLKHLFLKLPPVRVRMVPLHRYGYEDGLTYLMLYQQSVKEDKFSLKNFLNDAGDGEMLKRRVKVLVLGYCLGLITAIPQEANTTGNKKSTASIASRILRRIRGM